MIKQEIRCDNCKKDLSLTSNSIDYRLRFSDEIIKSHDSAVTEVKIYPSLKDGDCHFCGLGCLKMWAFKM